ncbi:hypothetical protein FB451DRAFT_1164448 [Mycena latifolia]|nr:hypothetical protein FB451DRAFT_1164448 [Mycena latifolia]
MAWVEARRRGDKHAEGRGVARAVRMERGVRIARSELPDKSILLGDSGARQKGHPDSDEISNEPSSGWSSMPWTKRGPGVTERKSNLKGKGIWVMVVESKTGLPFRAKCIPMQSTNLDVSEMIPDTLNPNHDPRFWCLPPTRDNATEGQSGRFPMYLVTQGQIVGIWRSWTATKAMVSGYPSGAQRGHRSVAGCVEEWQVHCRLGVHPHPPDPNAADVPALAPSSPASSPPPSSPPPPWSPPGSPTTAIPSGISTSEVASVSDSWACWDDVPAGARYYAIWEEGIVYADRQDAKVGFVAAQAGGRRPRILSTGLYEEAQSFSEGIYWVLD